MSWNINFCDRWSYNIKRAVAHDSDNSLIFENILLNILIYGSITFTLEFVPFAFLSNHFPRLMALYDVENRKLKFKTKTVMKKMLEMGLLTFSKKYSRIMVFVAFKRFTYISFVKWKEKSYFIMNILMFFSVYSSASQIPSLEENNNKKQVNSLS